MTNDTDILWFNRIQQGDEESFRLFFDTYYVVLCRYVNTLMEDEAAAEDLVQDLFLYIWEHRLTIAITDSVRNYLFTACRNRVLNYLRDRQRFTRFDTEQHETVYEEWAVETEDLLRLIEEAVSSLPEKCGKIFRMSREEELSHKEIALREGVSSKTVEAHIHTALKRLKKYLTTHLKIFL